MTSISDTLDKLLTTEGSLAAAVVDSGSGMLLGGVGTAVDLEIAAAGNTEVVRAKLQTMKSLALRDTIDDILITLTTQYHIIRPLATNPEVFIYFVLDKARSNLALARMNAKSADAALEL